MPFGTEVKRKGGRLGQCSYGKHGLQHTENVGQRGKQPRKINSVIRDPTGTPDIFKSACMKKQAEGDTAQITDFAQTWYKCWVWRVNDYGKILV